MSRAPSPSLTATCACGNVELKAFGQPLVSNVCYCDDCQKGADQIEALPNASPVNDPDGGTPYILYRKDRIACSKGADLLKGYKLKETSPTNRMVATCCNTAMFVSFDKGPHWIPAYRSRFRGDLPPLQTRIFTKFKPEGTVLPDDVPRYKSFPPSFIVTMLTSRLAMLFGR